LRARAAFAYAGPAVPFVHAWKERGLRRLAPLAASLVADRVACPAADVITYIPPDLVRQLERSRHPAPALAEELATRWQLPCRPLLRRTRSTSRQASLGLAERGGNVRDLFAPHEEPPERVALVDDVYTSGATVNAASRALRRGGARHVEVVTFARVIRWG
jgi:predicted amidophosphoribosyltransferase